MCLLLQISRSLQQSLLNFIFKKQQQQSLRCRYSCTCAELRITAWRHVVAWRYSSTHIYFQLCSWWLLCTRLGKPPTWFRWMGAEKLSCSYWEPNSIYLVIPPITYALYWLTYPSSTKAGIKQNFLLKMRAKTKLLSWWPVTGIFKPWYMDTLGSS
jgi:hypothetical protein